MGGGGVKQGLWGFIFIRMGVGYYGGMVVGGAHSGRSGSGILREVNGRRWGLIAGAVDSKC